MAPLSPTPVFCSGDNQARQKKPFMDIHERLLFALPPLFVAVSGPIANIGLEHLIFEALRFKYRLGNIVK